MSRLIPSLVVPAVLLASAALADDAKLPPIKRIKGVQPKRSIFKAAKRNKPLVIKTAEEAGKHFGKDAVEKLKKQVQFGKQIVLVFAWRGSGRDKLTYQVLESFPEQVVFNYKPGRTRDLRPHVYVFALRANVKWRAGRKKTKNIKR